MKIYQTDWIGTKPVFYNTRTLKVSYNINDVINFRDLEFDPEGFNNYLEFGYSVFGQTPVKYVKFLPPSARLSTAGNKITVTVNDDPAEKWYGKTTKPEEAIQALEQGVRHVEKMHKNDIILPLSGGFDSRLLAALIQNKQNVYTYSYGLSKNQKDSFEVVYAKKAANILGMKWKQIYLGDYHKYIPLWNNMFGSSVHAHGMYQIEFYKKIVKNHKKNSLVMSGIYGDVFAGSIRKITNLNVQNLSLLGYTHGLHADKQYSLLKAGDDLRYDYWTKNKTKLQSDFFQVLSLLRFKMILISYLLTVPEYEHLVPVAPYLDLEVAMRFLTIDQKYRNNRLWEKDYFRKRGLFIESLSLPCSYENSLDLYAFQRNPLPPLNTRLLREVIDIKYIEGINRSLIKNKFNEHIEHMYFNSRSPLISKILYYTSMSVFQKTYTAYMTLKSIENLIRQRNNSRKGYNRQEK